MSRNKDNSKISFGRKASKGKVEPKKAALKLEDLGDEKETFKTESLPYTGHDSAVDDDQQPYRSADLIAAVAETLEKLDKPTARRLKTLAANTRRIAEDIGIEDTRSKTWPHLSKTSDLESTENIPGLADNSTAVDDDQMGGKLSFYGTNPPKKGEAGPEKKASRKAESNKPEDVLVDLFQRWNGTTEDEKNKIVKGLKDKFPKMTSDQMKKLEEVSKGEPNLEAVVKKLKSEDATASKWAGEDVTACPHGDFVEELKSFADNLPKDKYEAHHELFHQAFKNMQDCCDDVAEDTDPTAGMGDGQPAMAKKEARKASVADESPWTSFKKSLKRVASSGGHWAQGEWSQSTEDLGKVMDLHVNTNQADGNPLTASSVTFSLVKENKKSKIATIEVADPMVGHETRLYDVPVHQVANFAKKWAASTEKVAKEQLEAAE